MKWKIAFLLFLLLPATASAHGLIIHAEVKLDDPLGQGEGVMMVFVTVTFDDDTPLVAGRVRILDSLGKVVSTATTDASGKAVLPQPPGGLYQIVADDSAGHKKSIPFDVSMGGVVHFEPPAEPNPWLMIALGLAIIAALTIILRQVRRHRTQKGKISNAPSKSAD